MPLFEAPGAKALSMALLFRAILCAMGANGVLLTHDCLNKPNQ